MPDREIIYPEETLKQMETGQLDAMLRSELEEEQPDTRLVHSLLNILQEREKDCPVETDANIERAWRAYVAKTGGGRKRSGRVLLKVASVAIVIAILSLALPQRAEAESLWDRLIRWTDGVFEVFTPGGRSTEPDAYVFRTDNPGLRQVYDTVSGYGVTEPVVPMWLPKEFELVDFKVSEARSKINVHATFSDGYSQIVLSIDIYTNGFPIKYQKKDTSIENMEIENIRHDVIRNIDTTVAVWTRDNVECFLSIDGQGEFLQDILLSIYHWGGI